MVLDLSRRHGQDLLCDLVRETDFIVESFAPGAMDALGLGYAALQATNPQLIMASMTPFGQQGPYSTFQATDLIRMAMGGLMELTGEGNGRPVRITVPQAALHAGMEAAVDYRRGRRALGSIHEIGHPEWGHDHRFTTLAGRLQHAEVLDAMLVEWTRTQRAEDVMMRLQSAGIPAGVVQNIQDLRQDPQLAHRGFWVELDHSEIGPLAIEGHQFRFSSLCHRPGFARPGLGEHNAQVLGDILGLSAEEIARLEAEGVIY